MELPNKVIKALSAHKWYHATTKKNYESIRQHGVIADFNIGKELDFGYGFYLTTTSEKAENYLSRMADIYGEEPLAVMEFCFCPMDWIESGQYKMRYFEHYDSEFAEFVFMNRTMAQSHQQQHEFDFIYGVMSDSVPTQLLIQYRAGDIDKAAVLDGLQRSNSMKQLSIHNQNLCNLIVLSGAYEFNPRTNERKELEINERESVANC